MIKWIILFVLVSAFVSATDFEIEQVKVYVSDERISGADEDGGDFRAYRGDTVDFVITVLNNMDNNTRARINFLVEAIADGSDIEKELDWFNVNAEDDKTKTMSFVVPDDTEYDNYDIEIRVEYEDRNNTKWTIRKDYEIDVDEVVIAEEERVMSLLNYLNESQKEMLRLLKEQYSYVDLNINLSEKNVELLEKYGYIATELNESRLKEKNTQLRVTDINESMKLKNDEILNLKSQLANKNTEMGGMISRVQHQQELEEVKKSQQQIFYIIGGGAIIYFIVQQRKKKEQSVGDMMYEEE